MLVRMRTAGVTPRIAPSLSMLTQVTYLVQLAQGFDHEVPSAVSFSGRRGHPLLGGWVLPHIRS